VVADYGFARKSRNDVAMTICGTDEFMAPEVIFGEVYDERADVFSFGVFLCELICRKVPGRDGFLQREPRSKFQLDFDAMRAMAPADAPASLLELAVQCCCYEAEYRMTSEVRVAAGAGGPGTGVSVRCNALLEPRR
jgi:serine/threonine protein kinase